jgi:small-conductance mechanosensitive channel
VLHEASIIGAGIALIRLSGLLIFRIVLPRARMTPTRIAEDFFVIIAYIGWGMVRLRYAGLDLGSIVATSAMITAVVAFAMQDTLGNILGGLALQLDNSVQIGDLDQGGRYCRTRGGYTLAFHAGRDAQLGNGGVSEQPVDEK